MKSIDSFLDEIYRDSKLNPLELGEMREEMRNHLMDYIQDGIANGLTEEQAANEAFEHFGGNSDIFDNYQTPVLQRKWNVYWTISVICLSAMLLLLITVWGGRQFYSNERISYYNALWSELYRNEKPDTTGIKSIVQQEADRGHIKDTLITVGGDSTAPIIFTTLGNEGFPQYDNLLIQTKVEARAAVHPNYNKVYEIRYSYNTVRDSIVIILGLVLFILSVFFVAVGAAKYKRG